MNGARKVQLVVMLAGALGLAGCNGFSAQPTNTTPATQAYLAGQDKTTVLEYSLSNSVNAIPTAALPLPQFNYMSYPVCLTTDSAGQLYVATSSVTEPGTEVLIYSPNPADTATPIRTISIPTFVSAMAATPTVLYVGSVASDGITPTVTAYSTAQSGSAVVLRTIQLAADERLVDIAVDATGTVYVAGYVNTGYEEVSSHIDVYARDASGTDMPERSITTPLVIYGVAVDSKGDVFASLQAVAPSVGPSPPTLIEEFAPSANGAASPASTINVFTTGGTTDAWIGPVRLDGGGNIYTLLGVYDYGTDQATESIYGFAPSVAGSASPTVQVSLSSYYEYGALFGVN